jgi:hypothetical protein
MVYLLLLYVTVDRVEEQAWVVECRQDVPVVREGAHLVHTVVLQWCYSDVVVVFTVVLQCECRQDVPVVRESAHLVQSWVSDSHADGVR